MHQTLAALLENQRTGLLWVQGDGVVRHANAEATARTGLAPGRRLDDPELSRALATAIQGKSPVNLAAGRASGTDAAPVRRVLPGLGADDAFVLIGDGAATDSPRVAFDNLMSVIRGELRDPLHRTWTALASAETDPRAVAPLLAQATELMTLLDRLADLSEVWGSDSLRSDDRIEPIPLLQEVIGDLSRLAASRPVEVRLRQRADGGPMAVLYGSRVWLRRVFSECLRSALESARRGSAIDIELRQLGPRALFVFRDSGAFARMSFASARRNVPAGTAPANEAADLIGLKLCQHIVSLHGGHLREEREDGLRNFLIDLPTGAPHGAALAGLDIAQAQRYAHDLAALMTRSRPRTGAD